MSPYSAIFDRLSGRESEAYSMIRIFLGIALFIRGLILLVNPDALLRLEGIDNLHMFYSYIIAAHALGGLLMAVGFLTRLTALFQIPILFSALFVVHLRHGFMMGGQSMELAALVLFLLLIYLVFGSGKWALDNYFNIKI